MIIRAAQWTCLLFAVLMSGCQLTSVTAPQKPEVSFKPPVLTRQGNLRGEVLLQALGLIGTPYRNRGDTPDVGFDCSGLVGYVFRQAAGLSLPRTTSDLMSMPVPRVKRSALDVGDLVFFATTKGSKKVSHVGIYSGDGRFVHAPSSGGTVRVDYLSDSYWSKHYLGANRVLP